MLHHRHELMPRLWSQILLFQPENENRLRLARPRLAGWRQARTRDKPFGRCDGPLALGRVPLKVSDGFSGLRQISGRAQRRDQRVAVAQSRLYTAGVGTSIDTHGHQAKAKGGPGCLCSLQKTRRPMVTRGLGTTSGLFFLNVARDGFEGILPEPGLDAITHDHGGFLRFFIDRPRRLDGDLIDDQAAHRGQQ